MRTTGPAPGQLRLPVGGLDEAAEGARLRDEAFDRAKKGAPAVALVEALMAVEHVARKQPTLTTDHVWARLTEIDALSLPERRAMGAVMRQAERERLVVSTPQHELSTRKDCHRRPLRVWRSRLYPGPSWRGEHAP